MHNMKSTRVMLLAVVFEKIVPVYNFSAIWQASFATFRAT